MSTFALVALLIAGSSPVWAQAESAADPTGVTATFFQAIRSKDFDRIVALTAPVVEATKPKVRPYYEKMAGRTVPVLLAHLQLSQAAVVVFVDQPVGAGPIDLDPAYLVKRNGKWLLLYKLTRFDRSDFQLSEEEKAEFQRLESWYKQQKPVLQQLLRN